MLYIQNFASALLYPRPLTFPRQWSRSKPLKRFLRNDSEYFNNVCPLEPLAGAVALLNPPEAPQGVPAELQPGHDGPRPEIQEEPGRGGGRGKL